MKELPWVIVGLGRVGRALCVLAGRQGIDVRATWTRADAEPLTALAGELAGAAVFVTVSDGAIAEVADELAPLCAEAALVVHCSGSISSAVLVDAGITAPVGSVHPLLAVADPEEAAARMGSAFWTIEGSEEVAEWAQAWLGRLGVSPARIEPAHKALYHAAAVTSAGLLVGLIDAAFATAAAASLSREQARAMLLPLARSTLDNLESRSTAEALTGPVARGDDAVVEAHRAALARLADPNLLEIYDALTRRTRALARTSREN